jgi:ABC-type antimicrobial peptide transport system permease subunit
MNKLRVFLFLLVTVLVGNGLCAVPNVDTNRIRADVETLVSFGSRVTGYAGNRKAADLITQRFRALGLEVMTQEFPVAVPMDEGAELKVNGSMGQWVNGPIKLYPLWPNLVRTSQLAPEGITGTLIYAGDGELSRFNGKDVKGSIVLLDFNCGLRWLNAPMLGAAAVIFIEPEETTRGEAERKYLRVPVDVPRFYLKKSEGERLKSLLRGETTVQLRCHMPWREVIGRNIIGFLPGTDSTLKEEVITFTAYYDSISAVPSIAPGAEQACGVATLLEMARLFARQRPKRSVLFVATDAHAHALTGARKFFDLFGKETKRLPYQPEKPAGFVRKLLDVLGWKYRRVDKSIRDQQKAIGQMKRESSKEAGLRAKGSTLKARLRFAEQDLRLTRKFLNYKLPFVIGLDLSTQNNVVGVFHSGWYFTNVDLTRFFSPIGKGFTKYIEEIRGTKTPSSPPLTSPYFPLLPPTSFVDAINPTQDRNWQTYLPGKLAFDAEMATRSARPGVCLATINDARSYVNTPLDTLERVKWDNLAPQAQVSAYLCWRVANDENLADMLKRLRGLRYDQQLVEGRVLEFKRTKSFLPNTPVPGSLAVVQGMYKTCMGVHTDLFAFADADGYFQMKGQMYYTSSQVEAYHLNPNTGEIDYAPDRGNDGDAKYPRDVLGRIGLRRPVIVFPCKPLNLFDLVDERYFETLEQIHVYEAKSHNEPISFGYSPPVSESATAGPTGGGDSLSYVEPCCVIYALPGSHIKITMGMGLLGIRLMLVNTEPGSARLQPSSRKGSAGASLSLVPEGEGFSVDEIKSIPLTSLQAARDIYNLDESRMAELRRHKVINERLESLHQLAKSELDSAFKHIEGKRYDLAIAAARSAWAYESHAYPDVQSTALDVVKGILFYLALLLPFAYFMERLIFAFPSIYKQIAGTVGMFLAVFIMLRYVHPAFELKVAPVIILLAFIILTLACVVIFIVTGKFNEQLEKLKQEASGVHTADVGRISATTAAFNLGIANMRRRKARTALTCITLVLLTFTVLSFTSVKSYLRKNQIDLGRKPVYTGIMIRDKVWSPLKEPSFAAIANEFGSAVIVSPRAWISSENYDKRAQIDVEAVTALGGKRYTVNGIIGLSPQERQILNVQKTLVAGRWFTAEDQYVVILPESIAKALGIRQEGAGEPSDPKTQTPEPKTPMPLPQVKIYGTPFTVIGIVREPSAISRIAAQWDAVVKAVKEATDDAEAQKKVTDLTHVAAAEVTALFPQIKSAVDKGEKPTAKSEATFEDLKDLDGEPLMPVDYAQLKPEVLEELKQQRQKRLQLGKTSESTLIQEYTHFQISNTVLIPYHTAMNMGGTLRSIALKFDDPKKVNETVNSLVQRYALSMYAGANGSTSLYSAIGLSAFGGLESVFMPIIIAALIVLNTMLGAVYERTKEIGIFSAVGLAPVHISTLFLAESCVYANIGAIIGYLLGQVTTKVLSELELLSVLTLNYSSFSAVGVTIIIVATVIVSTMYPARKAAQIAVPDVERKWRLPEPDGDEMTIRLPFMLTGGHAKACCAFLVEFFEAYVDYTGGEFYTDAVHFDAFETELGRGYSITMRLWLAPYDLGVSQWLDLRMTPTEEGHVFEIVLHLTRESGDVNSWKKTNWLFLNTLRKQFLIWRTISPASKLEYEQRAEEMLTMSVAG